MKTITVRANEVSQPYYAGAGSRITLTGSGYVEWAGVEKLQDALNGATWQTWPAGSTAGYRDTDRGMAIRVAGTGDCTVTVEEGKADRANENAYWQGVGDNATVITDPVTGRSVIQDIPVAVAIGQSGAAATAPADTAENVLATVVIPAGWMGKNGRIEVLALWSCNSSAGAKTMRVKFGGATVLTLAATTTQSTRTTTNIINRNSEVNQMVGAATAATGYQDFLGSGTANAAYTEDTTSDVAVTITGQKSAGGDMLTLEYYSVVIYPHG